MEKIDRSALLKAYIEAANGKPVTYGVDDCTMWAAKWVRQLTGFRVMPRKYSSKAQALQLIADAGSLEAIWTAALDRVGKFETFDPPQIGDVGIIDTHLFGQVGVILGHDGVAFWRAKDGVALLRPRSFVKVWAI